MISSSSKNSVDLGFYLDQDRLNTDKILFEVRDSPLSLDVLRKMDQKGMAGMLMNNSLSLNSSISLQIKSDFLNQPSFKNEDSTFDISRHLGYNMKILEQIEICKDLTLNLSKTHEPIGNQSPLEDVYNSSLNIL